MLAEEVFRKRALRKRAFGRGLEEEDQVSEIDAISVHTNVDRIQKLMQKLLDQYWEIAAVTGRGVKSMYFVSQWIKALENSKASLADSNL